MSLRSKQLVVNWISEHKQQTGESFFPTCTEKLPLPQYKNKCVCNVSNHFPEYKNKSKANMKLRLATHIRKVKNYLSEHICKLMYIIYRRKEVNNLLCS
jgi:hypothetical protein